MFVYVPILRPKGFSRVKTAARFTAEDPWHPGLLASFTVDEYAPTLTNNQAISPTTKEWRWFVGFYRALNYDSQPGKQRRFLPDSLVELWLTGQVPTENLPYLLHAIEPTLKGRNGSDDARPLLRDRRLKILTVVETILCAILEICVIVGVIAAPAPPLIAVAIVLGATALLAFFLDQLCYSKIRRRRRQMHWLLAHQAESAPPATTAPQTQAQAQHGWPTEDRLVVHAFDDALFFPRDRKSQPPYLPPQTQTTPQTAKPADPARRTDFESIFGPSPAPPPPLNITPPPPLPPWNVPHDYTYDTTLSVPEPLEPKMESILQRDIPELRWQDEAENWGKIRIVGATPDPDPRVTVSIARKEPPGPFNLRIIVRGVIRPAADAFHKAIIQRIELALYASAKTAPQVTSSSSASKSSFRPPFFSRQSLLQVPESLEPGMALRIKAAIPELTFVDQAPDWEQVRIIANSNNPNPRTLVSILRGDPPGPFRLWVHTTATSEAVAQQILTSLLDRIRAASGAIPPDVTFESQLSILEPQAPMLAATLQERIPEFNWQNHAGSGDSMLVSGATLHPTPRVLVSITYRQPPGPFFVPLNIKIEVRGCFEAEAGIFHQALLQRLHASLNPATYTYTQAAPPTTIQPAEVAYPEPFQPPFFSLLASVSVAEEFEMDTMADFVARLQDQIPELAWIGVAEAGPEIRIAALSIGPSGILPTPNTIQSCSLSLFRRSPHSPFNVWIHITAASRLDAERALDLLYLRLSLTLRSRYSGPWVPLPGAPMTRDLPTDYPPIFHLDFRMEAPPPGLPLDMEFRLNDGTPGAPWKTIVHNGERKGVYLKTDNLHGFQLISILAQPEPDRIRVLIDTTAESQERLEVFRQYFIGKIQKILLNPIRRP